MFQKQRQQRQGIRSPIRFIITKVKVIDPEKSEAGNSLFVSKAYRETMETIIYLDVFREILRK